MDDALHPLTLLTLGAYGEALSEKNGAPLRLLVPWKYGFKSAKLITRMTLTDKQPLSNWKETAPREHSFYSSVNPNIDHPRWTQATRRRIGAGVFSSKINPQLFNGYSKVTSLYAQMDLRREC